MFLNILGFAFRFELDKSAMAWCSSDFIHDGCLRSSSGILVLSLVG